MAFYEDRDRKCVSNVKLEGIARKQKKMECNEWRMIGGGTCLNDICLYTDKTDINLIVHFFFCYCLRLFAFLSSKFVFSFFFKSQNVCCCRYYCRCAVVGFINSVFTVASGKNKKKKLV